MKYTAILIDDEAWTRDVLRGLGNWNEYGIEIIAEASDGEYGLELISRLQPNIILTDVKMPHMDGLTLLQTLRGRGNQAKVIFVSGYDDFSFIHSAMKLQAMDYLLKPVKSEELNEILARCVGELDSRTGEKGGQNLDLHGFMNVDWIKDYQLLRDAIYESLHSEIPTLLHSRFQSLYEFVSSQEGKSLSKSLEICIYFDLHSLLQHFILGSGYTLDDVFGENLPSFVFSNDFSFGDMLNFVESLYEEAKKRVEKLVRSQNRVDIQKIKQYIDGNFLNGITLEDTAARFYISKEYLSKIFKMESGSNFSDYVTDMKMKKSQRIAADRQGSDQRNRGNCWLCRSASLL